MKKNIYSVLVVLVLSSCGGAGDDSVITQEPENNAPSIPTLKVPANNLLCSDNNLSFQWNASLDPDGNPVTYQIQIAKDNQFSQIDYTTISAAEVSQIVSLEKGMRYYWRVKAIDSKNLSSNYSSVYQFYTEGFGISNHLPFAPSVVKPDLNASIQGISVQLEWSASDVDVTDILTYDVYLGTVNPPISKVSTDQILKTYTVNLNVASNYYWRVDVKDNKGGITKGQVWSFKTN